VAERGFVLTPTYRTVAGRPQVHLYAVLENGEPALIVEDRFRPYLFVLERQADQVDGAVVRPTALRSVGGEPLVRIEVTLPSDVPPLRGRLAVAGVRSFEADVRFAYRYLIDCDVRGAFSVEGSFERRAVLGRVYRNPALAPADWVPTLRVLSFDIETSPDGRRLYSIACAGTGGERVFLIHRREVAGAVVVPDERALVDAFLAHLRESDPDVLTGWNVADFDLPVLRRAARAAGRRLTLGRDDEEVDFQRERGFTRESRVLVNGRVVLDGLALMRSSYVRLDDYRLETAAQTILGRGKLFGPDHRATEIESAYRDAPERLVAYNLEDARLVLDLLRATSLVELTVRRSLTTGMQLDRVSAQIAAIDSLYLRALRARGRVAPSVDPEAAAAGIAGGLVLDSRPGLYRNILVFDFRSLYPSLIRTFNIDPLTYVGAADAGVADVQKTPSGAMFRRDEEGILPALVARLWAERSAAKARGDAIGSQATKILMNSLFGVLGSPASRLFSPAVANAITAAGRWVIERAAAYVSSRGYVVVYGDTDSLFVDGAGDDPGRARVLGETLRAEVSAALVERLATEFGCASHLELEFEKVYERFWMPEVRGGATGSKKRYAGLAGGRLELVGLEAVRRDWSGVARRFQRELLARVFRDEPVDGFIAETLASLRAGRLDGELVYRKAVRKPLETYTRTTPPHVQAARKQPGGEGGRIVRYVVTRAGPEPVDALTAPPDYGHYVETQLRPIAEAILRFVPGVDFAALAGLTRQLSLF
jgi:DNA polymerase-2